MYYFFESEVLNEKKVMILTGTMYYENKKFEDGLFDTGDYIDVAKYNSGFEIILNEKESKYKKRTLTDRIILTVVNIGEMPLVSSRFVEFIEQNRVTNVQFFNVQIQASDFELTDYKLMNVVGKYDCMDIEKSEVELNDDDGYIFNLENLVLNEDKIPKGQQIFLLGRKYGALILIKEDLKNAMEKKGLTGIEYRTIDNR